MLDFFRDQLSAPEILDYLEHLPRTSAYHSAIADDEELAAELAGQDDAATPRPPRLAEFSPEVQVMAEVRDLLASLIGVQIARAGKKPQKIKPYPRPESALERVRRRQQYATHRSLVGRMLPRRD
jgi:aminoglycoside/choline kinase family phosphotransferase